MIESRRVPERGNPGEYRRRYDLGEYRKGVIRASIRKGRIRASTEKGRIRASTGKGELYPSEYQIKGPGEYRKRDHIRGRCRRSRNKKGIKSGRVSENPKQANRSKETQGKEVGPSMTSRVYQEMT